MREAAPVVPTEPREVEAVAEVNEICKRVSLFSFHEGSLKACQVCGRAVQGCRHKEKRPIP